MKKYGVLLYIINDYISCSSRYCLYPRVLSIPIFVMLTVETKIISMTTKQDILSNRIPKRSLVEKLVNFLNTLKKMSKKKKTVNQRIKAETKYTKDGYY